MLGAQFRYPQSVVMSFFGITLESLNKQLSKQLKYNIH
ncbi:hypothetical protein MYVALT_F_00281 [Candidatus Vallotia tarda]|uniref:Uncharacterized protein n=1 Tax=Candidatus Vallotiella hemipterorum TaxID=1177213 RepID=A0A916NLM6_9BURK|nr:hypothetical protein MYVALT_F_00281 [Candidatus Vallotia tarda]